MMEVKKWQIFEQLENEFIKKVKLIYVFEFQQDKRSAFLVTRDDNVYAIGANVSGYFGLGHENDCPNLTKVESLCNKRIKEFACGWDHVLVLTEDSHVYGMGCNNFGVVGNGPMREKITLPVLIEALENKDIIKINVSPFHSVALARNGKVYAWGCNLCGQIGTGTVSDFHPTPMEVAMGNVNVIDVKCGGRFSLALTDDGQVFVWGRSNVIGFGGTGVQQESTPHRLLVCLEDVKIKQIACGGDHALVLSEVGDVYAWGRNDCGIIGSGTKITHTFPYKIKVLSNIEQISCCIFSLFSTAMTRDGECFIWGRCTEDFDLAREVLTPRRTSVSSLLDAFARYAVPSVTPETVVVKVAADPLPTIEEISSFGALSVVSSLSKALDNKDLSDLTFVVGGRNIYVNKLILRLRSKYFGNMLSGSWKEAQKREIEITNCSYETFKYFIDFLYKGMFPTLFQEILDLMDLADYYCEEELTHFCKMILQQTEIGLENAGVLYKAALKYDLKALKIFCTKYMFKNWKQIEKTKAFQVLNEGAKENYFEDAKMLTLIEGNRIKSNQSNYSTDMANFGLI